MKAGDLVTLSAYSRKLVFISGHLARRHYKRTGNIERGCAQHSEDCPSRLIGLVTKVLYGTEDERPWVQTDRYRVAWVDKEDAPPGRDHYENYFHRRDLKMVSKA